MLGRSCTGRQKFPCTTFNVKRFNVQSHLQHRRVVMPTATVRGFVMKRFLSTRMRLVISVLAGLSVVPLYVSGFQQQPQPLPRLRANIERIANSVNAKWGIYIKCIETGEEIAINADDVMDTMSVIKIPLMVEAFRQIEEGKFALTDRVVLRDGDKRPGTGIMRSLDAGASFTIRDVITLMNIVSDNTATDMMFEKVGGTEPVNKLMRSYGLSTITATGTAELWFKAIAAAKGSADFHREGKTPFGLSSPRDMGKLFERISRGEAVSKRASEEMLQIMHGQIYRTRLPKYATRYNLPHKTGDFLPFI